MQTVERDGFAWARAGFDTDDHLGSDPHEANLEPIFRELLGQDRVFLDVGAHVGHWTVRLAAQASHVFAVEANPETAALLRENLFLNRLEARVTVISTAAWDCRSTLRLEDPNGKLRGGSTRTLDTAGEGATVPAAPLDDCLGEVPAVGLVKLDVEGADLHALRGLRRTLKRTRPSMIIERHDQFGYYKVEDLYDTLTGLGYNWRAGPGYMGAEYLICEPRGA